MNKTSVFVVDDNPSDLQMLNKFLNELNYEVRVATDGEAALDSIEAVRPDIVLMDVQMPKINGYETCKRLKSNEKTKNIPVVFISAMHDDADKKLGFDAGGVDYLDKPFSFEELRARIDVHVELAHKIKELEMFNKAMMEREMRIIELKREINLLSQECSSTIRYPEVV